MTDAFALPFFRTAVVLTLVLAGILRRQFAAVARAYKELGLRLAAHRRENEWHSGVFAQT